MRVPSSSCSIFPRTLESLACAGCLPAPYPACPNIAFLDGARSDVTPVTFAPFICLSGTVVEQYIRSPRRILPNNLGCRRELGARVLRRRRNLPARLGAGGRRGGLGRRAWTAGEGHLRRTPSGLSGAGVCESAPRTRRGNGGTRRCVILRRRLYARLYRNLVTRGRFGERAASTDSAGASPGVPGVQWVAGCAGAHRVRP